MSQTIVLDSTPSSRSLYTRAAVGTLPLPLNGERSDTLPDRRVELSGIRLDPQRLAEYCGATGLRVTDSLPLTYPFVLTFPVVMHLVVQRDFPFAAVGAVHAENRIERLRDISVSEPLDITAHAANLREHRKGMLVDVLSDITTAGEVVWRQTTTFLHQQKTSLSGEPKPEPKPEEVPPPPLRTLRVEQQTIARYAAASGDRNPIHVSTIGAKAFGFPRTIAHGMWSAAAILGAVEGRIAPAVTYSVKFGKPILLPSTVNVYADRVGNGWDLALRHRTKGYPYLTATLR